MGGRRGVEPGFLVLVEVRMSLKAMKNAMGVVGETRSQGSLEG